MNIQDLDTAVFDWVQAHLQQPAIQYVARDITSLGGDTLTAAFTIFVTGALWLSGNRSRALWFLGSMLMTAVLIVSLKLLIGRPCPMHPDPFQHHPDFPMGAISLHLPCMPSGHTTGSTVLYSLILFVVLETSPGCNRSWRKWVGAWLLILPPMIACTRIILSAHWLSDVLVGYCLGWGIVLVSQHTQKFILTHQ